VVGSHEVVALEDRFRQAVDTGGPFEAAGEVCYWKNYRSHQARDRLTERLLQFLAPPQRWASFRDAVRSAGFQPSCAAFQALRAACGQPNGFATPVTFLAFYAPEAFPMVDKHIAEWWAAHRERFGLQHSPPFAVRQADGWIQAMTRPKTEQNWAAYLAWARFCRDYASRLRGWRARDVEMAVWTAQKGGDDLPVLDPSGGSD